MKIKYLAAITMIIAILGTTNAQTEYDQIASTLTDYIEGTANGIPDRVTKAFHPDLNLYSVAGDSLRVWNGKDYIGGIKEGRKSNRVGKIISIDYTKDAASAKVEIVIPNRGIFTDYFLLLKYQGTWKVIHKIYTSEDFPDK
tara:strand:- start:14588 stop:15013 length:426 start_codon:yes stop_codon:yes gene_type:complete